MMRSKFSGMRTGGAALVVMIAFAFLSCRSRSSGGLREVSGAAPTRAVNEYLGCFPIKDVKTISTKQQLGPLDSAKTVCIEDTAEGASVGSFEQYAFHFKTDQQVISQTVMLGWSNAQPRCPGCYAFKGKAGTALWNGEQMDAPIELDMDLKSLQANVTFTLSRPTKTP